MKKTILSLALMISSTAAYASDDQIEIAPKKMESAAVALVKKMESAESAAVALVKKLYGKPGDSTTVLPVEDSPYPKFRVLLTNEANEGSVTYVVNFKVLKLSSEDEGETVSNIEIIYESSN